MAGLSRSRIVEAAIALLDEAGESGLTFRALSAALKTGPGAIYWHVANKSELLVAATEAVLEAVLEAPPGPGPEGPRGPEGAIRTLALGVFDAIDAHPWVGTQVARPESQPMALAIFERFGQQIQVIGAPIEAQFDAASALLYYTLGVAGQNAANARAQDPGTSRTDVLAGASAELDPADFPFLHAVAGQLRDHDDRAQFLAGVDLILAGIRSSAR
ncbi:TetR family transcriptional regulator [Cryptosporangium phraense]|uniref:TetR family transcriptional regulator n=1 Tax=Cryptosporangium phraense TaxID=2593070 RepID=A0A545AI26_9ACTN|nr:TetR family transcriptional regulator [Cryptosporangium phraense]TQS40974.1 TetR family transcriptional regulator [Cryptosporangium phraense]